MNRMFVIATIIAAALVSYAIPSVAQADVGDFVVVANKQVEGSSINLAALKGIYLREVKSWGNGSTIVPVDLSSANEFYQNLFGKTYVQMQAYWLNMRIKYSVDLPVTKKDAASAKKYIAENKGAIGFLKNTDVDDSIKVLKVIN